MRTGIKRTLIAYLCMLLAYNPVFACDFSSDIKKNEDGSYTYTKDCHVEVGKKVKALEKREQQVDALEKTIELKDLAISKGHERTELWMDTSFKLEDRVNTLDRMKENNKILYFLLGVGVTGLAVWGAGQLNK